MLKNVKHVEIYISIATNFKDDLIDTNICFCYKNYQHKCDKKLKERFFNAYKFSNHGNNKFILLLQKVFYPYEYIDDWEKFNETLKKKIFTVT